MDGLMARKPYAKRIAQGASTGAMTGGAAGFKMGGPIPGLVGALSGGLSGAFMARPGDDEERLLSKKCLCIHGMYLVTWRNYIGV